MSAIGILDAAYVVFYHPLDGDPNNFKEHTTGEVWSGAATPVPGKIGEGDSAVTSSSIMLGAVNTFAPSGTGLRNAPLLLAALSDTKFVAVWHSRPSAGGDDNSYGAVATVSGTSVTFGAASAPLKSGNVDGSYTFAPRGIRISALDSTHVVACYATAALDGFVKIGTVSGTDLTWGAASQYHTGGLGRDNTCVALDPTHVVVAYSDSGVGKAKAGLVSGGAVSFGAEVTWGNDSDAYWEGGSIAMVALTASTFVLTHMKGGSSRVGTVSGADLTLGPACAITGAPTTSDGWQDIALLAPSKVVLVFSDGPSMNGSATIGTVSGTDITWGALSPFYTYPGGQSQCCVAVLGPSTIIVSYFDNSAGMYGEGRTKIGTVSGTNITFGTFSTFRSEPVRYPFVSKVTATTFLQVWTDAHGADLGAAKASVNSLDVSAALAGTSGSYPTAVGKTRVAAAMWAKGLTYGSSTVTVERGYRIDMTATSISLGGTTAVWSGAGIAALMTALNSGGSNPPYYNDGIHLLVLDFENTSGTTWRLRTSLDGLPWVDQDTQTSGSQVVATTNTAPRLAIAAGEANQWIDELVLWVGDKAAFALFAPDELMNLQDLADVFGQPMDQYEEYFGAPICWQATARMPDGSAWRDSGCGPCPPVVRVPRGATDVVVTDDGAAASPRIVEG